MNTHKNARMTAHGRALLVKRIEDEDWPVAEAAREGVVAWMRRACVLGLERDGRFLARVREGFAEASQPGGNGCAGRFAARCIHPQRAHALLVQRTSLKKATAYSHGATPVLQSVHI